MKNKYKQIKALIAAASLSAFTAGAQTYCSQSAGSTADDEIFNVTFGTLNNSSTCSQTGGGASQLNRYSDYTSLVAAPVLMLGQNYNLSVTVGQCGSWAYGGEIGVWIDYNGNGSFTDPGENVWTSGYNTWQVTGTQITAPGGVTIPMGATPGTTRMRVTAVEGSVGGPCSGYTWGETEDYNVMIVVPSPCSGTPAVNSVVAPTAAICPNANAGLNIATTYTDYGYAYQWYSSTSSNIGPWTMLTGTNPAYTASNVTTNTWYQAVVTCTNGMASRTITAAQVSVQPVTISQVPYFEGFEGITAIDELPNCSWWRSNVNNTQTYLSAQNQSRIPRTGSKFASFYYFPSGDNYFYTNGIQLYAGVTYSASVWYMTEYYGYDSWEELSIMVGSAQSPTSMVTVATVTGNVSAPSHKSLSNTFTVATDGVYYVAIKGVSNNNCCAYYLSWDDLAITIPCELNPTNVTINSNKTTLCAGETANLSATGADTYLWNTGATTANLNVAPMTSTTYVVAGNDTITDCPASSSIYIQVNPTPVVGIVPSQIKVCQGGSVNLIAYGASTYTWFPASNAPFNTVIPTGPVATYSLSGSNQYGCTASAVQQITVHPLPTITAQVSHTSACMGEAVTIVPGGASSYQVMAPSAFIQGTIAVVYPMVATQYNIVGTDVNGCTNNHVVAVEVKDCTGLDHLSSLSGLNVYPNPAHSSVYISLDNDLVKDIVLTDVTGRVVAQQQTTAVSSSIDIDHLANGVYYLKISNAGAVQTMKVVKQ